MIISFDVGMKNLAYCVYHDSIVHWGVLDLGNSKNTENIAKSIVSQLNDDIFKDADIILIEKQPTRNPKMRSIEAMLCMFFTLREQKVICYSPKFKLKNCAKINSYTDRKKMSVRLCKQYLDKTTNKFLETFQSSKKKDDLADCLLQVLSYVDCGIFNNLDPDETPEIIRPRKPTEKQMRTKRFSKSNLKYFELKNNEQAVDSNNVQHD